jgi:hypothetical protein
MPVNAQRIETIVTADKTVPTTGSRQQPNNPAVGTVQFTNRSSEQRFVPANTELVADNGKHFRTVNALTIPGTDFIGGTFGRANVDVVALEPGPDSNDTTLVGSYGDAVFVSLGPTSGGDTIAVATVAEADLAALDAALKADIDARAGNELLAKVPPNLVAITCTLQFNLNDATMTASPPPLGSDATEVRGVMEAKIAVYAFAPAEVQDHAARAALDAAPSGLPVKAQIDPASVNAATLTLARQGGCDGGRVVYTTQIASPRLLYSMDPAVVAEAIRPLLVCLTAEEAQAVIKASPYGPYIESVEVNMAGPPLLPADHIPATVDKIQIEVAGSAAPLEVAPTPLPTATGEPR